MQARHEREILRNFRRAGEILLCPPTALSFVSASVPIIPLIIFSIYKTLHWKYRAKQKEKERERERERERESGVAFGGLTGAVDQSAVALWRETRIPGLETSVLTTPTLADPPAPPPPPPAPPPAVPGPGLSQNLFSSSDRCNFALSLAATRASIVRCLSREPSPSPLVLSLQSAVNCFQLNCLPFSRHPFAARHRLFAPFNVARFRDSPNFPTTERQRERERERDDRSSSIEGVNRRNARNISSGNTQKRREAFEFSLASRKSCETKRKEFPNTEW